VAYSQSTKEFPIRRLAFLQGFVPLNYPRFGFFGVYAQRMNMARASYRSYIYHPSRANCREPKKSAPEYHL
jgi:hypothetical protein